MVLETLGWGKESREDINFVLESRLNYTQPTDVNWRNLFSVKMSPISALLVTLGQNTLAPTCQLPRREESPRFSKETGCREAALILLKEKGLRYSPVREALQLDKCVICWEQEWDDCFEASSFLIWENMNQVRGGDRPLLVSAVTDCDLPHVDISASSNLTVLTAQVGVAGGLGDVAEGTIEQRALDKRVTSRRK